MCYCCRIRRLINKFNARESGYVLCVVLCYVLERRFTKFVEITQFHHYAVQGNSRSPILVPIENS